jgi:hypothetical protein
VARDVKAARAPGRGGRGGAVRAARSAACVPGPRVSVGPGPGSHAILCPLMGTKPGRAACGDRAGLGHCGCHGP